MKVFLYERVSSEEQARHGYSLDAQHEALTAFCEKNKHAVLGVYKDEGISARKPYTKRPAMLKLLADLEKVKPDIILFTKLDRWFRNIKEYYKVQDILDKNSVDWKAINEEYDKSTASGRLYVNIKLSIAQDEADRTSERIKDIQGQLVAQGKVLGGKVPIGYKIENKRLVQGENIEIVKEAISYYKLHQSLSKTCKHLNDEYGTAFHHHHLKRLLSNTILYGSYRNNPNFVEPLISIDEYNELQSMLAKNIKFAPKKHTHLFSGLIKCPACGSTLAGCNNGRWKYYRCRNYLLHTCDYPKHVSEMKIEKWLLDNIEDDFNVYVKMQDKKKNESPKKYEDRLKRLNDIYVLGNIDEEEYRIKSAELQQKIAELQKKPVLKTQNFASNWKEVYQLLDDEHKRSFWRGLISEIRVDLERQVVEVVY